MKQFGWLLLTSLLVASLAGAVPDDNPEAVAPDAPTTPPPMPLQVMAPTQKALPFDRVMYVLDVSCSMTDKLADAIRVTDTFSSDGFKATAVTFTTHYERWSGVPYPCQHAKDEACGRNCLEPGWAWMPLHRRELFQHLLRYAATGTTAPTEALLYAIKNAPEGTLIVFISDGEFAYEDPESVIVPMLPGPNQMGPISAMRSAMAWRQKQKLAPVEILVWATSEDDSKRGSLIEMAKVGGGGLWRADTRRSGPW